MRRPPLAGFAVSAVAHLAAVAVAILVVTRTTPLPPLFIDLTTATEPDDRGRAAASAANTKPPAPPRTSLPARALPSSTPRTLAAPPPKLRAPVVDLADSAPSTTPAPLPPPGVPESPSIVGDTAPTAPRSETPIVTERSPEAATEAITASSPGARSAGSSPSASGSSGGTASAIAADAAPGGGGAGGRAGQGLALATPGASAIGTSGGSGAPGAEYAEYLARFRQRIQETLRYPVPARRRELSGTVHLDVTIQPDGGIAAVTVVQSSSHASLDDAALETVRSLHPVPFPKGVTPRILQVRVPVVFELR